jgi:hypothetical protein
MTKTPKPNNLKILSPRLKSLFLLGVSALLIMTSVMLSGATYNTPSIDERTAKPIQLETRSTFSQRLQGLFGLNALAGWVAQHQLEKEIRQKVDGYLDIDIKPYSGLDLMDGKAKSLEIHGEDLLYDKSFYVREFYLKTYQETPLWIDVKSGDLKSPLKADMRVRLTQTDLNRS